MVVAGVGCIGRTAIWRESAGVESEGVTQARKDDWTETDVQPTSLTLEAMRWPLFRHTGERPGQARPQYLCTGVSRP